MFVIVLKFSANKDKASQFMKGHKDWIKSGIEDGAFLLVGSLQPGLGGAILAQDASRPALEKRVEADPFVAEDVVKAEILEIAPSQADPRLGFLLG